MSRKLKNLFKKIGLISLGIGAVGAVGLGAKTAYDYLKNDTKSIHPTFEVGGLGNDGEYVKDESTLYTKNLFACEGLSATLDFDSDISYQFFFYDIDKNFVSASEVYTKGTSADVPLNGAYARVEITPLNDDDGKISLKERVTYPSQLNLKVSKKAESNVSKKFVNYRGKNLQVVVDIHDLVFTSGICLDANGNWETDNYKATTTSCLLKIDDARKLIFDANHIDLEGSWCKLDIVEFNSLSMDKLSFSFITSKSGEVTLNKDTEYVLLTVNCESVNDTVKINSSVVSLSK